MKVSLVVPVKNESRTIVKLLTSMNSQTVTPTELVIVDGGSTDGTPDIIEAWAAEHPHPTPIRVIRTAHAYPGRGRNLGIADARYDWIALTDAGIGLEPDWLQRLVEVAERDETTDVVYGNYEPSDGSFFERCAAVTYISAKTPRNGRPMRGPVIASCLLKRKVWQSVGGFPDLRAAEDLIFMEQVQKQGFHIEWAPDATIHWQIPSSLGKTFRRFALYSKHNVWAGRQHDWHYGIARQYAAASVLIALAILHSKWWLVLLGLGALGRVLKSVWVRRDQHGLLWVLQPVRLLTVGAILLTIDLATFIGWGKAYLSPRPSPASAPRPT